MTTRGTSALLCALAGVALCGAAPAQTCDSPQAAQKLAEAQLSPSERRMVGNFPPRVTPRNNNLYWEVAWQSLQAGGRPVVMMVNRTTCNVISARP